MRSDAPSRPLRAVAAPVEPTLLVDLLHPQPQAQVDAAELSANLGFAFAGGGCADVLEGALTRAELVPSGWEPSEFAASLFVEELVETCMKVVIDGRPVTIDTGFVVSVLTHPPVDVAVVTHRREVLSELAAKPTVRACLEELVGRLIRLRALFDDAPSSTYEATQRRVDILTLVKEIIDATGAFADLDSALARIAHLGEAVRDTPAFERLTELLDYEQELAQVDVRLVVGIDGRVRRFEVVHLAENERNRYHQGPFGRLWTRLQLWWRGFGFGRSELVNRWLDHVFQGLRPWLPWLFQLLGHAEVYLAAEALRARCEAAGLPVCFPELSDDGPRAVEGLFNPLLFAQGTTPVPCDLAETGPAATTIVTGPNSGGKTRLLQALGLLQLLAQAGFWAPAAAAKLRRASGLFVSLSDDATFDQREGRLGTELMRIRRLFETAQPGAVCILDELCSGTNPSEGEEIFMLVLELLRELRLEVFITTHFLSFAQRLADEGTMDLHFLQVELEDDHPTYGFVPGVATTSLAAQTAARLGVTRDELRALIKAK